MPSRNGLQRLKVCPPGSRGPWLHYAGVPWGTASGEAPGRWGMVENSARQDGALHKAAGSMMLLWRKPRCLHVFLGQKIPAQPSQLDLQIHEFSALWVVLKMLDHNNWLDCQQVILIALQSTLSCPNRTTTLYSSYNPIECCKRIPVKEGCKDFHFSPLLQMPIVFLNFLSCKFSHYFLCQCWLSLFLLYINLEQNLFRCFKLQMCGKIQFSTLKRKFCVWVRERCTEGKKQGIAQKWQTFETWNLA